MRKITITESEESVDENGLSTSHMNVDAHNISGAFLLDAMVSLVDTASRLTQLSRPQIVMMFIEAMETTEVESNQPSKESGEPINEVKRSID